MILRTYVCADCNYMMEVELRADQWDQDAPECPRCDGSTRQDFKAPAIGGTLATKARDTALEIAEQDYGVANYKSRPKGEPPDVRYKDAAAGGGSTWGVGGQNATHAALEQAAAIGRETRLQHGSGLDIIKTMPDMIAASRRRSARVW